MDIARNMQNKAAWLSALVVVLVIASPYAIAWGIQAKNDNASAAQTKEFAHVSLAEIGAASQVFTNRTGVVQKVDLCPTIAAGTAQSCAGPAGTGDATLCGGGCLSTVANANGGTVSGIEVYATGTPPVNDTGWFQNNLAAWIAQENNSDPAQPSYVLLSLKNETAYSFLKNTVTQYTYSFKVVSSGFYYPARDANATTGSVQYHTASTADFTLTTGYVYGTQTLIVTPAMDMTYGSKGTGTNYTSQGRVAFTNLVQAKVDGQNFGVVSPQSDNGVTVRLDGVHPGGGLDASTQFGTPTNQGAPDTVIFTVQFLQPNSPGITSYSDGYGFGETLFGLGFLAIGFFAGPWHALKGIDRVGRKGVR